MSVTGNAARVAASRESGFWMLGVVMSMSELGGHRVRDLVGHVGGNPGSGPGRRCDEVAESRGGDR